MSSIEILKKALQQYQPLGQIPQLLEGNKTISLRGAPGSLRAFVTSLIVESGRRVVWITPRSSIRDEALSDLSQLLPDDQVALLLSPESKGDFSPFEARIFRARALHNWILSSEMDYAGKALAMIADPASTWLNILPRRENLDRIRIHLHPGATLGRDRLAQHLIQAGYIRSDLAENRGEFGIRGGILDVFPYTHDAPLRLEFWGERLESLRSFDPVTQRTIEHLPGGTLFLSSVEGENGAPLTAYLKDKDALFIEEPEEIRLLAERAGASAEWRSLTENNVTLLWGSPRQDVLRHDLNAIPQEDFGGQIDRLAQSLSEHASRGSTVYIACDNEGQLERLREMLAERMIDSPPQFLVLHLSGGFRLPHDAPSLYTDHQIFRRPRRRRTYFRLRNFSPIERADVLKKGDFVVHEDYGIGCYQGLSTIQVRGHARECLQIEYRDDVTLYVRLESLKKVQKYSGREGFVPPLTRIGRGEWEKIRKRAHTAVKALATELIGLYALRSAQTGHAFQSDGPLQREVEAAFEYEETPDQLKAIEEVKRDMEEPKPMDRLVCGDVGYGKTEVALRAAFKAIVGGKQVAVLVPTTLLAQQHYSTFATRLAEVGVEIEMLSRFRTLSQQKDILKRLESGRVDIVIGTHRLLSKDVAFNNLGLLIVDEEHRFGVRHKEKLKKLRSQIDVLTLTATPIPRTLHLAMVGARDMSVINTPPHARLPIETEIAPFSQELISEAILREVSRGGQVYFVHNRIGSIEAIKRMLERWLPEIRFLVAHGQMPERQLERTMSEFLTGKHDCLISTAIIESGLDLPNVNTMIVNRADRFGLAQLYQLRGRIGRSNRQAYAYLLTPPNLSGSDPARKRLDAIRDCSYLGAGFQLAMHDLEIRGAGEIFGARQSGFIHAIGFDLYQKMLGEAVQGLRKNGVVTEAVETNDVNRRNPRDKIEPKIEFPFDAFLPTDYVEHPEQRVDLYRRLSRCDDLNSLERLLEEIKDRYGLPPREAHHLFDMMTLKLLCQQAGLSRLELGEDLLLVEFDPEELSEDGQGWRARLEEVIRNLEGVPLEFSGGNPPQIRFRWEAQNGWDERIFFAKGVLHKLI